MGLLASCIRSDDTAERAVDRAKSTPCGEAWGLLRMQNQVLYGVAFPDSDEATGLLRRLTDARFEEPTEFIEQLQDAARTALKSDDIDARRTLLSEVYGFTYLDQFFELYATQRGGNLPAWEAWQPVEGVPEMLVQRAVSLEDRSEDILMLWEMWPFPQEIPAVQATIELAEQSSPQELLVLCDPGREWSGLRFERMDFSHLEALDLSGADFSDANLKHVTFEGARLDGADFAGADLSFAKFWDTSLVGADFIGATLEWTHFSGADLTGAHFHRSNARDVLGWNDSICPDGISSAASGDSCEDHLGS
ncbi:MAG: pentapeptide repeat-containing protein [Actinobacteria bacterium]|nr:pentapeptide repeat-containing protein [Actinomycetota bacterium]